VRPCLLLFCRAVIFPGEIVRRLLTGDVLPKLSRYEQRIERSLYRAIAELRQLQAEFLPEGEWLDAEADGEPTDVGEVAEPTDAAGADDDDRAAGRHRTRETKPRTENSENAAPPPEGDGDEEEDESEDDTDERPRADAAAALPRETKPDAEYSELAGPPAAGAAPARRPQAPPRPHRDKGDGGPMPKTISAGCAVAAARHGGNVRNIREVRQRRPAGRAEPPECRRPP